MARFTIMMRGYDMGEVDRLMSCAERAAESGDAGLRAAVCRELRTARLRDRLRCYSRLQVDQAIDQLARELGGEEQNRAGRGVPPRFTIMMRGYDMAEVDQLMSRAERAAESGDPGLRAAACRELRTARLRDRLRGYSRPQVDQSIDQLARELTAAPPT